MASKGRCRKRRQRDDPPHPAVSRLEYLQSVLDAYRASTDRTVKVHHLVHLVHFAYDRRNHGHFRSLQLPLLFLDAIEECEGEDAQRCGMAGLCNCMHNVDIQEDVIGSGGHGLYCPMSLANNLKTSTDGCVGDLIFYTWKSKSHGMALCKCRIGSMVATLGES